MELEFKQRPLQKDGSRTVKREESDQLALLKIRAKQQKQKEDNEAENKKKKEFAAKIAEETRAEKQELAERHLKEKQTI